MTAIDQLNVEHPFIGALFEQVLHATIVKCRRPSSSSAEWDSLSVELHDEYRASAADTFAHCHERLGDRALRLVLDVFDGRSPWSSG